MVVAGFTVRLGICFIFPFFFLAQPTEYGAEGFFLRRCPDVGVGRGTPGDLGV